MHKKILILLLIATLVITVTGCGGGGSSKPSTGSISGIITLNFNSTSLITTKSSITNGLPMVKMKTFKTTPKTISHEKIIKFCAGTSETEIKNLIRNMGGQIKTKIYGTDTTYVIKVDSSNITSFGTKNTLIEYIENNLVVTTFATPNDDRYSEQWNCSMLNLSAAWDQQKGNSNIIVAVIDSGISLNHPDLSANLVTGYDFYDDDSNPSDTIWDNNYQNIYSHGTHVAGIISAVTNNSIGISGVAWNVKIMPLRVIGPDDSGNTADIVNAINWAVNKGANVINLSIGIDGVNPGDPGTKTLQDAIDNAISHNVTVVAAAGNSAGAVSFPANYDPVVAVSALGSNGNITSYSSYGPKIDFCTPGGDDPPITNPATQMILSPSFNKENQENTYVYMSGTSMAAPHISGLAALLYSRGYTTPSDIIDRLKLGSIDKGTSGKDDYFGYGMPNAYSVINGASFGQAAVKVFISLDGTNMGTLYDCNLNGSYAINNIQPGLKYICAFLDNNFNEKVDSGDLYAFHKVTIEAGVAITQNLTLNAYNSLTRLSVNDFFKKLIQAMK